MHHVRKSVVLHSDLIISANDGLTAHGNLDEFLNRVSRLSQLLIIRWITVPNERLPTTPDRNICTKFP